MMANDTERPMHQVLLQSKDHKELLNVIDLLRSQGLNRYVHLPQVIVCGDQSSGKSSVLEAISGVRFPTKDNLCTRFATELILRRGPVKKAKAEIIPGSERSKEEKRRLSGFQMPPVDISKFSLLIETAKEAMGLRSESRAFSDDILRVEISGPEQSNLTLVDLPGLIHAENKQQTAKDVEMVSSLVRSYMANRRSIILAVVSAKNDYANQVVTKLAHDHDPKGIRTLGIITKPDTLHVGSDGERSFIALSRNESVVFRLGWHVLKNRGYEERDHSVAERDESEKEFFSQGVWTSLPPRILGIGSLTPRLSTVLRDQIISELPSLIQDVEDGIEDCRRRLTNLGDARATIREQQLYLIRISQSFSSLVQAAVDGTYTDHFFGDATTQDGYNKRLRAVVANVLTTFATEMREEGHNEKIVEENPPAPNGTFPRRISKTDFIKNVCDLMSRSKGRELSGTFNPLIIGDLFYRQSKPWRGIVDDYSERILEATRWTVELILNHVTHGTTREGILLEVVGPAMERYTSQLAQRVSEIMLQHQSGHPITYNRSFAEAVHKARREYTEREQLRHINAYLTVPTKSGSNVIRREVDAGDLLAVMNKAFEDMDHHASLEALIHMEAYYNVSVDDPG